MVPRLWLSGIVAGLCAALVTAPLVARCAPQNSAVRHFRVRRNLVLVTAGESAASQGEFAACAAAPQRETEYALAAVRELLTRANHLVLAVVPGASACANWISARLLADPQGRQFSLASSPLRC
jgi:hypothetical protein